MSRRRFLIGASAGAGAILTGAYVWRGPLESGHRSHTFITRAASYDADLVRPIIDGLRALELGDAFHDQRVLLKPNLVEPHADATHINTHPVVVASAAEAFRKLGAREVIVAEGQGHRRDSLLVLEESSLGPLLREERIPYVDLNYDDLFQQRLQLPFSGMEELTFPATLKQVDWVVSLPKLKTHHWAGVTLSMKNFFGVMPGVVYGWPKNVLHHAGIIESIVDIYRGLNGADIRTLAIVDGIVGMEGDGPIMGQACNAGVLVMGTNLTSVDATASRVMKIDPEKLPFLDLAGGITGPIHESHIIQRGDSIASVARAFELLDRIPAHRGIRLEG